MAANLYRTRAMFQIPRVIPALIARTQTTQTTPTAGKGIPTPGNFDSAIPPPPSSNTTGNRAAPSFGNPAAQQSFINTPAGILGAVAVASIAAYAGYKMFIGNKEDSKAPKDKEDSKAPKDKEDSKAPKDKEDSKAPKDKEDSKAPKDKKDQKDNEKNKAGGDQQGKDAKK